MPPIDRLSALDSAFLDLDSARAPLHVGWTILVDGRQSAALTGGQTYFIEFYTDGPTYTMVDPQITITP